ncbi:MAG: hypothetical protein NC133_02720 [Prevotella sp.]|nr:hypothetical protein [Prevotella sp.]
MNLSKNLIVALIGLGFYARCNNINLANNTTILLIILALLAKWQASEDSDNNVSSQSNNPTAQNNNGCGCNANRTTSTTQPCNVTYGVPFSQSNGCPCTYQSTVPYWSQGVMPVNWGTPFGATCHNCTSNNIVF